MLCSPIIYYVKCGKQKLEENEGGGLVNQIHASFKSPGCTVSVSNMAPHAITDGTRNVAPISSKKRGKQGSECSKLKTPYKIGEIFQVKSKRKLLNLKGRTYKKSSTVQLKKLCALGKMRKSKCQSRRSCLLRQPGSLFHPMFPPRQGPHYLPKQ